jgi:hypothetical protein
MYLCRPSEASTRYCVIPGGYPPQTWDNDIGFLRFFRHINFQSSRKLSFFSFQNACQTNNFSLRTTNFARTSQRASHTNKKNLMMLPLIWRLQWKYFQGSVNLAHTVFFNNFHISFFSKQFALKKGWVQCDLPCDIRYKRLRNIQPFCVGRGGAQAAAR